MIRNCITELNFDLGVSGLLTLYQDENVNKITTIGLVKQNF